MKEVKSIMQNTSIRHERVAQFPQNNLRDCLKMTCAIVQNRVVLLPKKEGRYCLKKKGAILYQRMALFC